MRNLIHTLGGSCYVLSQSQKLYGSPGIPDCWCMFGDGAFWVEVKVGKDSLSAHQQVFKERCEGAGIPVVVGGVDEVVAFIKSGEGEG